MIKNIMTYAVKSSVAILLIALVISCKDQVNETVYFYSVLNEDDSIPKTFFANKIIEKKGIRKIIQFRYSVNSDQITDTLIEYFKVTNTGLYKLSKKQNLESQCYLLTQKDTCIVCNFPDSILNEVLQTKICFMGLKTINLKNKNKVIEAYEFTREMGIYESTKFRIYYNKSFILLKEEYISGSCPNFEKELTDSVPEKFRILFNKITTAKF